MTETLLELDDRMGAWLAEASKPWWESLKAEWDSTTCGVCGQEKWAYHPFCRSCSIRCQRVGLMRTIQMWAGVHASDGRTVGVHWAIAYDRVRDYLIVTRREKLHARPNPNHDSGECGDAEPESRIAF